MSILLGKSVDFVVLRRHLNRCGFMNEHVSTFVSQPGASASPLGGQCHPSSPRVLHSLGLWPGRHSNLFVTLPLREDVGGDDTIAQYFLSPLCPHGIHLFATSPCPVNTGCCVEAIIITICYGR